MGRPRGARRRDPLWPLTARSKQFIGPHNVTIGGFTLNIDTDLVSSPVFHGG